MFIIPNPLYVSYYNIPKLLECLYEKSLIFSNV